MQPFFTSKGYSNYKTSRATPTGENKSKFLFAQIIHALALTVALWPGAIAAEKYEFFIRRMDDYSYRISPKPSSHSLYSQAGWGPEAYDSQPPFHGALNFNYHSSHGRWFVEAAKESVSYHTYRDNYSYNLNGSGLYTSYLNTSHGLETGKVVGFYNMIPYKMGIGVGVRNIKAYLDVSDMSVIPLIMFTGNGLRYGQYREEFAGAGSILSFRYDLDFSPNIFLRTELSGFYVPGSYKVNNFSEYGEGSASTNRLLDYNQPNELYYTILNPINESVSASGGSLGLTFHFNRTDYHGIVLGSRIETISIDWPSSRILESRIPITANDNRLPDLTDQMIENALDAAVHRRLNPSEQKRISRWTSYFGFKVRFGELKEFRYRETDKIEYSELPAPGPGPVQKQGDTVEEETEGNVPPGSFPETLQPRE